MSSYQRALLAHTPLGFWPLGADAGDVSGFARDGAAVGGPTFGVDGPTTADDGVTLDGNDDQIDVASTAMNLTGGPLTVCAWANQSTPSADAGIAGTGFAGGFQISWWNGDVFFYIGSGPVNVNAPLSAPGWHFIVGTWDGTTNANGMKLYVDGVLVAQATAATTTLTATGFRIGLSSTRFNGSVALAAVFSSALSAATIRDLYAEASVLATGERVPEYAVLGLSRLERTRLDYYKPSAQVSVGGTLRSRMIDKKTLRIIVHERLAEFECFDFPISKGQEVIVALGTLSNRIFAGHVVNIEQAAPHADQRVRYRVTCFDYTWLLETRRITGRRYLAESPSTIVVDLMTFAPPGFSTTNVEASLDPVDFTANHAETLWQAIQRLMKMASKGSLKGGYAYVDYTKGLHAFVTPETTNNPTALTPTNRTFWDLTYRDGLSQSRSRVYVLGGITQARSTVPNTAVAIPVDATDKFNAAGGFALSYGNQLVYAGTSPTSGAGWLTGVASLVYAIPQGENVRVLAIRTNSSTAQSLAARLGSGDGLIDHVIEDERLSDDAARDRGDADLEKFATEEGVHFKTRDKFCALNKPLPVSLTAPTTISTQLLVQQVTLTDIGIGANPRFPIREVDAALVNHDAFGLIADVDQLNTEGPL